MMTKLATLVSKAIKIPAIANVNINCMFKFVIIVIKKYVRGGR